MATPNANGKPNLGTRLVSRALRSGVKRGRKTLVRRIKFSSPGGYVVVRVANRLFGNDFDEKGAELLHQAGVTARDFVRERIEARRGSSATPPENQL
jgi:hypothetical protein